MSPTEPTRVLLVCHNNAVRSRMAERLLHAWGNSFTPGETVGMPCSAQESRPKDCTSSRVV
jgi:protein-tyrosine-phosphatase